MKATQKPVLNVIVPNGLKIAVEKASTNIGCSQGEIVRTALYTFLKDLSLLSGFKDDRNILPMKRLEKVGVGSNND